MADKPQISKIHEHVLKNQKIDDDVVPSSLGGSKPGFLKWLLKPPKILAVATAALVITVDSNQVIDNQPAQSPPHPISQPPVEQLPQSSPNDYWENLFNQVEDSILSMMLQPEARLYLEPQRLWRGFS